MDISFKDAHRKFQTTAFNIMVKPIGPICNLNCTYCYYLEKKNLYESVQNFKMSHKVLETFIKEYIQGQKAPVINFVWQGGEPTLMGIDFYKKAVELQQKYKGNKTIENSFQTNATKIDEDWARFLAESEFLVGVSIDGPKWIHDKYRRYKNGQGSFDDVMKAIELLKKHRAEFNTLSVVNDYNSHYPRDVYRFLKGIESKFMQFIPIVEQYAAPDEDTPVELISPDFQGKSEVTEWSVNPKQYGKFLTTIFDEWVTRDVGKYFVQIFDTTLANWVNQNPGLCVFDRTCGEAAVLEFNGDLYSCDHFVYHENYLGNIMETPMVELMKSEKQMNFGLRKEYNLPEKCNKCKFKKMCRGGCPKNRVTETGVPEKRLNYLCEGYQHFFSHVVPYMNYMANELRNKRPPANVMRWAKKYQVH
ncbi:MAG: anaerobic sulfatase-maturation protein [Bacteroidales bacterium]|nr:anaerobic sulfatase-maturation protein [Bacteroidales bacterium]MBS3776584.1 anaerobic sulfatase-maturation protein [Bacteroidales bacterium]